MHNSMPTNSKGITVSYNSDTGNLEVYAYAGAGEPIFKTVEPDFKRAMDISDAIHEAFKQGWALGRLNLQSQVEAFMDQKNV